MEIFFNPEEIIGKLSTLARVQLPRAASTALNLTAFKVREALQVGARTAFKEVNPFTFASFLYDKSTPNNLMAKIYIRFDAPKGNAPSNYLAPHIYGGMAYRTRFAKGLSRMRDPSPLGMGSAILAPNKIMAPTQSPQGVNFNSYGRMMPSQYQQILSYIENTDSTRTATTGRKSAGRAGVRYFYMNQTMADIRRNLKMSKPGIFKVNNGKLMRIMTEIKTPRFDAKFKFFDIGFETANREFPLLLSQQKFL
jgi:hypothetical protein